MVDDVFGLVVCDVPDGVLGFVFGNVVGTFAVFIVVAGNDVFGDLVGVVTGDVFGVVDVKVVCDVVGDVGPPTGRKHAALVVIFVV